MALCANFPTECSSSLCRTTWSGKLIGPENHFPSLPVKQFKPEKLALWRKTFSIDGFFGGHWSMSLEGTSEQGAGSEGQTSHIGDGIYLTVPAGGCIRIWLEP